MNLHNLVKSYKNEEITFEYLLSVIPTLEWAERVEDPDGAVDWVGDNYVAELDNFVLDGTLTIQEREAIVNVIS